MKSLAIGIANDHPRLRESFAELLISMGHWVMIHAANGRELLDFLNTAPQVPDVCITDLHMPVMDGFALSKELKEKFPTMKIIAFSMSENMVDIGKILACGADSFVYKGDYAELHELLLSFNE